MRTGPLRLRIFSAPVAAVALLFTVVSGYSGSAAPADDAAQPRLQEVERAIEEGRKQARQSQDKAAELARELGSLRRKMVTAAKAAQRREAEATRLEERLEELAEAEAEKMAELGDRREQFVQVLMALERMARHPPEALMAQPLGADAMVRSAILLRAAVPRIERRSEGLRRELEELVGLRADAAAKRSQLASALAGLKAERVRLNGLIDRKAALKDKTEGEVREARLRVEKLAREAKDLRDLMARIEAERQARLEAERQARAEAEKKAREDAKKAEKRSEAARKAAAGKKDRGTETAAVVPPSAPAPEIGVGSGAEIVPITRARGKLPFPVAGRVVGQYGQATKAGLTRKGISIETRDGAWVIAPYDGVVVFAGPFRGYGQILILEHGEGYHTLLAGLARIDTVIGQWLAAGEPVGLVESTGQGNPVLYVELRRNGQPINPLPWLASQKDKVSG